MNMETKEEKRDLKRLAKYYANEDKKMLRIAQRQERLIKRGALE